MSNYVEKIDDLRSQVDSVKVKLAIADKHKELENLEKLSSSSEFWKDNEKAKGIMLKISKLKDSIQPWDDMDNEISDILELAKLEDETLSEDIETQYVNLSKKFSELKKDLRFNGPYDDHDVYLSIYAGAGGTDAQDWAEMLYRMYYRYAEKNNLELNLIEQSSGEEAGLKSITVSISGKYAYGLLKGENGVHRLVRLSPFNSDNLRQTSFAKVEILPKIDEPKEIELDEKDLKIDVFRSGGHGGQSVNTTDSAVRITHLPTNISVTIQNERSQIQNKELAMSVLKSRLAKLQLEQHVEKVSELKGENQSAQWGNQIRSYVLHPYKQVKDLRSNYQSTDPDSILNGDIKPLIDAYLEANLTVKDKH